MWRIDANGNHARGNGSGMKYSAPRSTAAALIFRVNPHRRRTCWPDRLNGASARARHTSENWRIGGSLFRSVVFAMHGAS